LKVEDEDRGGGKGLVERPVRKNRPKVDRGKGPFTCRWQGAKVLRKNWEGMEETQKTGELGPGCGQRRQGRAVNDFR